MKSGTLFDNVLITDDPEYAKKVAEETWGKQKDVRGICIKVFLYLPFLYFIFILKENWNTVLFFDLSMVLVFRLRRLLLKRPRRRERRRYSFMISIIVYHSTWSICSCSSNLHILLLYLTTNLCFCFQESKNDPAESDVSVLYFF